MMHRTSLKLTAVVLGALVTGGALGGAAVAARQAEPGPDPTKISGENRSYKNGGLSSDQKDKALQHAANDRFLKKVLKDSGFRVLEVLPWYEPTGETVIGAVLRVEPRGGVDDAELSWPSMRFSPGPDGHIERFDTKMAVTDVAALTVFVDLRSEQVVAVEPDPRARRALSPDNPTFTSNE